MTDALHNRMYLLAYDAAVHGPFNRSRAAFLVRAAVIIELALGGQIVEADGEVHVTEAAAGAGPVTRGARVRYAAPGTGWRALLLRDRVETLQAVEEHLAAQGLLTIEDCRALVAPARHVTLTDLADCGTVHRQVAMVLHDTGPASGVPVADAALLALAAVGDLSQVVSRTDPRQRARIEVLTSRIGDIAPGLERAVRALPFELARPVSSFANTCHTPATGGGSTGRS
ncbi:GPP34 family phosphoprotein [Streptomyces griseoviridis]|uniref:GPP34 family phosphoprotein n=1 Tax=Streptomyces griseoviridis TaxID=45398 RepID=A0A3S9ZDL7_STRGD|nr:GPP34 family phosphoprotein [Streptomyces griseoviridis]AZS85896.1 GPP34 family phosphoprotein [Streptomyces griseoviridis]QCN87244.1 GPP34 family phosphoprotein [Streptomyces griseoviridis]